MDIVPRTVPYKKIVERKAKEAEEKKAQEVALENVAVTTNGINGASDEATADATVGATSEAKSKEDAEVAGAEDPSAQIEREIRAQSEKVAVEPVEVEKTNGHKEDEDGDVEMAE